MKFQIIDRQTGKQVGTDYLSRSRANGRADKLDNEHGGYRYFVKTVYPSPTLASVTMAVGAL